MTAFSTRRGSGGRKAGRPSLGRSLTAAILPHIDLILMDIRLPYEDGFEALRKLRRMEALRHIPVAAVTAYATEDLMARARQAGFEGFISKPLDADRFPDQVNKVLQGEPVWECN